MQLLERGISIHNVLIEAFVSFLMSNFSVYHLIFLSRYIFIMSMHGESMEQYLYIDGTVEYFGKQHLPYAILAIVALSILPLLHNVQKPFLKMMLGTFYIGGGI